MGDEVAKLAGSGQASYEIARQDAMFGKGDKQVRVPLGDVPALVG